MPQDPIAHRFRLASVPTLHASNAPRAPISVSHLRCDEEHHGASRPAPAEDSYVINVNLHDLRARFWKEGRPVAHDGAVGGTYMFNLQSDPIADFESAFDIVRFYLPRATLDELSRESGQRVGGGLTPPALGVRDPVMHNLARAMLPALSAPREANQLYVDYMAQAVHAHLVARYGAASGPCLPLRQGLSSMQSRVATELIAARLDGRLSIAELALACNLSQSHFARAFVQTFGTPPHRWMLERRVEMARSMLEKGDAQLLDIAQKCGFASQSHLTRVFTAVVGIPPSRWRRRVSRLGSAAGDWRA